MCISSSGSLPSLYFRISWGVKKTYRCLGLYPNPGAEPEDSWWWLLLFSSSLGDSNFSARSDWMTTDAGLCLTGALTLFETNSNFIPFERLPWQSIQSHPSHQILCFPVSFSLRFAISFLLSFSLSSFSLRGTYVIISLWSLILRTPAYCRGWDCEGQVMGWWVIVYYENYSLERPQRKFWGPLWPPPILSRPVAFPWLPLGQPLSAPWTTVHPFRGYYENSSGSPKWQLTFWVRSRTETCSPESSTSYNFLKCKPGRCVTSLALRTWKLFYPLPFFLHSLVHFVSLGKRKSRQACFTPSSSSGSQQKFFSNVIKCKYYGVKKKKNRDRFW